ncbi:MAG: AAA family ATPase, partial [Candidatus Dadabacteria bacterium]|nr:AAA family ATPase [Candidatus Dadabacteria bacterium]
MAKKEGLINDILTNRFRLKCKNHSQKQFANLIKEKEIVIASGPAGVGKSYVAIAKAIELIQIKSNNYDKLIVCKPAIEVEEKLGFMPGDMREKMEQYISSSLDIIDKIIGQRNRLMLEDIGVIVVQPLGFLRGKSIDNSIVVIEEAQNISQHQMKTLLTRIGTNSKFVISGDLDQSDRYKKIEHSGLFDAI